MSVWWCDCVGGGGGDGGGGGVGRWRWQDAEGEQGGLALYFDFNLFILNLKEV